MTLVDLERTTFGCIRSLVITLAEPLQILVFDPGHPPFVLLLVGFLDPFSVGFFLSLLGGQVVVEVLLLFFCVLASGARCLVDGIHLVHSYGRKRWQGEVQYRYLGM